MKQKSTIVLTLILLSTLGGVAAAVFVQEPAERKVKKVTRVARPNFSRRDWDGLYFEDLFSEALVGARPERASASERPQQLASSGGSGVSGATDATTGGKWTALVSATTLEDEVKSLQALLIEDITTPVKFKTEYAKSHQSFSMLSMIFAMIREYDGDVRWQRFAGAAQASFQRAAANARVGTSQAYESCRRRKEDLEEMVRGGNFAGTEKAPEALDWSEVVLRSPVMVRLQQSLDRLKVATSSESEFKDNLNLVVHEAELVAAMASVILQPDMQDAVETGYASFAQQMKAAATSAAQATKNQDFSTASKAVNLIGQSCSNCHDEWR